MSVIRWLLMLKYQTNCVGPLTTRSLTPAVVVFCSCAAGTLTQERNGWSAGASATSRSAIWSACSVKVNVKVSGYAVRSGSVFASQFGLRTSVSELPIAYLLILYGPDENGCRSYSVLVSLA